MEMHEEVRINCAHGIQPHLLELEQHADYRGLQNDGPSHQLNERLLTGITGHQSQMPTHLVTPAQWAGTDRLPTVMFQDGGTPPLDADVLEVLTPPDFMSIAFDEVSTW